MHVLLCHTRFSDAFGATPGGPVPVYKQYPSVSSDPCRAYILTCMGVEAGGRPNITSARRRASLQNIIAYLVDPCILYAIMTIEENGARTQMHSFAEAAMPRTLLQCALKLFSKPVGVLSNCFRHMQELVSFSKEDSIDYAPDPYTNCQALHSEK